MPNTAHPLLTLKSNQSMFVDSLIITLENIKGIKKLKFSAPLNAGVYVLTGVNGCGKSTLMTALARISDGSVFSEQFVETPFDSYKDAKISYHIEKGGKDYDVEYSRPKTNWKPSKKDFRLTRVSPFADVIYISTSNQRFLESNIRNRPIKKTGTDGTEATEQLREGMKRVFGTERFNTLRYRAIKSIGKGAKKPRRANKVYFVPTDKGNFSELNFSLGERMMLNALEALEHITEKSLLLIDEIELALHPVAQAHFYDYLEEISREKNIMVIISTHSPSLIRHASRRYFLEPQSDGCVEVVENCYPSYILRDITIEEERNEDYLLFVEDYQAKRLLTCITKEMKERENCSRKFTFKIIPVGGWDATVKLMAYFTCVKPYSKLNVETFPDKDVEEHINRIKEKEEDNRTNHDKRLLSLWNEWRSNICPLHITPELGVMEWLKRSSAQKILEQFLEEQYGTQTFRISEVIKEVLAQHIVKSEEENDEAEEQDGSREREIAKDELGILVGRLTETMLNKDKLYDLIFECYVKNNYDDIKKYYKFAFCRILNRH